MKTIPFMIAFIMSLSYIEAQEAKQGQTITVIINNITHNKGHVLLSLYTEANFMTDHGIENIKSNIVNGKVKATFNAVAPGTYAILALHDENDTNTMDFDSHGMPTESYGVSNNVMVMGPPEFASAQFDVKAEDLELTILF